MKDLFFSANPEAKMRVNEEWSRAVSGVAAHLHRPVGQMRVGILDAMDATRSHPQTAAGMGRAGVAPAHMTLVSSSPVEVDAMRGATRHGRLRGARVRHLHLGAGDAAGVAQALAPHAFDLFILDGCSARRRTLAMLHDIRPHLARNSVVILGVARSHNKDPLDPADRTALRALAGEDDDTAARLLRAASIQLVQHRLQMDMRAAGARPFWPLWGAMGQHSYASAQVMVYAAYALGDPGALPPAPAPLRAVHGVPLLAGSRSWWRAARWRCAAPPPRSRHGRKRRRQEEEPRAAPRRVPVAQRWYRPGLHAMRLRSERPAG